MRAAAAATALALATCGSSYHGREKMPDKAPTIALAKVKSGELCVTHGAIGQGADAALQIRDASVRAVALGSSGEAAALAFTYNGPTAKTSALASGDVRRQLGLKLRAENGCNLIYVMWRIDPEPGLVVQLKRAPGMSTHAECGAKGYTRLKADRSSKAPAVEIGTSHTLQAELDGQNLEVWADAKLVWHGRLPYPASGLSGVAGLRSDNVDVDADFLAESSSETNANVTATCEQADTERE